MFRWYMELSCKDEVLLAFLTTCFQEPSSTIIQDNRERFSIVGKEGKPCYLPSDFPSEKKENHYYWLSADFDLFPDPQDVLSYARQQLPLLNSIIRLKCGVRVRSIKLQDVYCTDEQGYLIKKTATVPPIEGGLVTSEIFLQAVNARKPSLGDVLSMAKNNPLVAEALQYFSTYQSWHSLEKIFELIRKDAGKKEDNGTLPKGTFNTWTQGRDFGKKRPGKSFDFLQTAHSYHWSGIGARHSSVESKKMEGVMPMNLSEAITYITDLFVKWLQTNP